MEVSIHKDILLSAFAFSDQFHIIDGSSMTIGRPIPHKVENVLPNFGSHIDFDCMDMLVFRSY